ncbi:hypothetical protein LTR85_002171 [Meristemomyces frigidus]|nr:hypothetical protein LTR85_002171 [Meristemomyces frigidus]
MSRRPIYLAISRLNRSQRAHFAIFVPNEADADKDPNDRDVTCKGTLIHVVGTPMTGFVHEFKRNHDCGQAQPPRTVVNLGSVDAAHISKPSYKTPSGDDIGWGALDKIALQVAAPRKSEDSLAPVDDLSNRRCQEWTMDYLRRLVEKGYIQSEAIAIAQSERDAPTHGIGLRSAGQR